MLIGKRVVDFLLVLIKLFSLDVCISMPAPSHRLTFRNHLTR